MASHHLKRAGFIAAISLIMSTACGASDRPAAAEWQPAWTAIVSVLPDEADLGPTPDRATCDEILSQLRSAAESLSPKPDPAIDDVVDQWLRVAEDAFFECPPLEGDITSFADAYSDMRRLEAEVDVVLRLDRGDS